MTKTTEKTVTAAERLTLEVARELKEGDKLILSPATRSFRAIAGTVAEVGPKGVHPGTYAPHEMLLDVKWPGDSGQISGGYSPEDFILPMETKWALMERRSGITLGSTVRVLKDGVIDRDDLDGRTGKVVGVNSWHGDILLVDFGEGFKGHSHVDRAVLVKGLEDIDLSKGTLWFVFIGSLELVPEEEEQPKLTPQARQVLDMILRTGRITGVQAWNVLKVRSLPRRIADLKAAGHKIISTMKTDHLGQRYAEYTLSA